MTRPALAGALSIALSAALLVSAAVPRDPAETATQDIIDADAVARADPEAGPAFRELDAQMTMARERLRMRQEVARDLAAGRLTLNAAAARFRELNAEQPGGLAVLARQFPTAGEDELVCRQVVGFVQALASTNGAARKALPGLTAEVARRFGSQPMGSAVQADPPHIPRPDGA